MMETSQFNRIFRRLFSHEVCSRSILRAASSSSTRPVASPPRAQPASRQQTRSRWSLFPDTQPELSTGWQQRTSFAPQDKVADFKVYPTITANELRNFKRRPRKVKMLIREFIEDSLYNPHYGYFSKEVVIWSPGKPFDFRAMQDEADFQKEFGRRYADFEDRLDQDGINDTRQIWHTPVELFMPYYGEAIANSIADNHLLRDHPFHDLLIYEMGAGNGTLMINILDHLRDVYPELYTRTKYRIIEISSQLAQIQQGRLLDALAEKNHLQHVEIVNASIFDWNTLVRDPCWFLALEVFDNFAHDIIRYDPETAAPLQGWVLLDEQGDFFEFYIPKLDDLASEFLKVRQLACLESEILKPGHPLRTPAWLRRLKARSPLGHNLTDAEYIPTRMMQFLQVLRDYFPQHRLIASDFHSLPNAIRGLNAPVVQTRYQRRMVPVRTPLVHQGFFDVLFPTDFTVLQGMYSLITGKLSRIGEQSDFLQRWADVEMCETESGENIMLGWYRNASVLVTESHPTRGHM